MVAEVRAGRLAWFAAVAEAAGLDDLERASLLGAVAVGLDRAEAAFRADARRGP